ncbi:elongin-A-like [Pelodytes ibericus]
MDAQSKIQRVQQLKERLSHAQDPKKISKALKSLQELDISLDILVETGIGKTVNGFRKHYDVGDIARAIVLQWKKLVPDGKEPPVDQKTKHVKKEVSEEKKLVPPVSRENNAFSEKYSSCREDTRLSYKTPGSDIHKKSNHLKEKSEKNSSSKKQNHEKSKSRSHSKEKDPKGLTHKAKTLEYNSSSSSAEKKRPSPKDEVQQFDKNLKRKSDAQANPKKEESAKKPNEKPHNDGDSDTPTMSFESYLNYDQLSVKRKKRTCSSSETPKKIQVCKQYCSVGLGKDEPAHIALNPATPEIKMEVDESSTGPVKEVKAGSLEHLLDLPLPKFLTDDALLCSPQHITDSKANVPEMAPDPGCESNGFTGRRFNSKMLVYSGSKTIYLPKMLTLYEQCIRVLQNNIDSIQEVGGVPFEILMPVLKRCTPEQLSRIEECNTAFLEDSGDLWKKHCDRDFRGYKLLEYESWREMYIRLFTEREEKLRMITQNISSAHSGKPKGRQVKLAYIHGAAKPPRNIRRKQEIHGTAGPIIQSHPMDKLKLQKPETKERFTPTNQTIPASACVITSNNPSAGPSQDPKRTVKRIAPMMAKTMRAFRNRVGPR